MKSGEDWQRKGRRMPRACMQKLCRSGMKAKERETTTHIRKLDGDLGNILIISLIGNA